MIHYRKSGDGLFYKFVEETGVTIRVKNKMYYAYLDVSYNRLVAEDAMDESSTVSITEEEFTSAYKEALERITTGRI